MFLIEYSSDFSKDLYDVWHYNDVKKHADKAFTENNKELYIFLTERLRPQPHFEDQPG